MGFLRPQLRSDERWRTHARGAAGRANRNMLLFLEFTDLNFPDALKKTFKTLFFSQFSAIFSHFRPISGPFSAIFCPFIRFYGFRPIFGLFWHVCMAVGADRTRRAVPTVPAVPSIWLFLCALTSPSHLAAKAILDPENPEKLGEIVKKRLNRAEKHDFGLILVILGVILRIFSEFS